MTQTPTVTVNRILRGDAATTMMTLPNNSISCIVTSPPYLSKRLYSGAEQTQALGGNPHCDHEWTAHDAGEFCHVCSAWRGALGLEPTVELYVEHLVDIFHIAKQKLRSDGVFYLNIGDGFCGSGSPGGDFRGGGRGDDYLRPYNRCGDGLKQKDLCLVPEKVVSALQKNGWYVRDRIAWIKRSHKPDSAKDRRSNSWEFVYMLTKSADYWYDAEAVREPYAQSSIDRFHYDSTALGDINERATDGRASQLGQRKPQESNMNGRNARNIITANPEPLRYQLCNGCKKIYGKREYTKLETVTIPSKNYSGGLTAPNHGDVGERAHKQHTSKRCTCGAIDWLTHTATFPKQLVEQLILAACPPWICKRCAKSRTRIVEGREPTNHIWRWTACGCSAGFRPGIVLDMFFGSGTSGLVAENLGRDWLGIEVSEDYRRLADYRIRHERKRPPTPVTELHRNGLTIM